MFAKLVSLKDHQDSRIKAITTIFLSVQQFVLALAIAAVAARPGYSAVTSYSSPAVVSAVAPAVVAPYATRTYHGVSAPLAYSSYVAPTTYSVPSAYAAPVSAYSYGAPVAYSYGVSPYTVY